MLYYDYINYIKETSQVSKVALTRLEEQTFNKLEKFAEKRKWKISQAIREIVSSYLEKNKETATV